MYGNKKKGRERRAGDKRRRGERWKRQVVKLVRNQNVGSTFQMANSLLLGRRLAMLQRLLKVSVGVALGSGRAVRLSDGGWFRAW